MKPAAFLDTVHVLALLNPRDARHARAVSASSATPDRLVTTEAVLTEIADALSEPAHRSWGLQAIDDLRADPNVTCVPVEAKLFGRGLDL
jgi:predicted nucleic acid-binding protein